MTWIRTIGGGVWHLAKPGAVTVGESTFAHCGTWLQSVISAWMMTQPPKTICKRCAEKAAKS